MYSKLLSGTSPLILGKHFSELDRARKTRNDIYSKLLSRTSPPLLGEHFSELANKPGKQNILYTASFCPEPPLSSWVNILVN
jgi:hypothetical protein